MCITFSQLREIPPGPKSPLSSGKINDPLSIIPLDTCQFLILNLGPTCSRWLARPRNIRNGLLRKYNGMPTVQVISLLVVLSLYILCNRKSSVGPELSAAFEALQKVTAHVALVQQKVSRPFAPQRESDPTNIFFHYLSTTRNKDLQLRPTNSHKSVRRPTPLVYFLQCKSSPVVKRDASKDIPYSLPHEP